MEFPNYDMKESCFSWGPPSCSRLGTAIKNKSSFQWLPRPGLPPPTSLSSQFPNPLPTQGSQANLGHREGGGRINRGVY